MAYQESRQSLLAKIHIAKKDLALPEDVYRSMVFNVTGKESCAHASYKALTAMVAEMRAKGWKGQSDSWLHYNSGPNFSEECQALGGKIRAILLDTDRSWNYAHGIAKRITGKPLEKCSSDELKKVVGVLSNGSRGRGKGAGVSAKGAIAPREAEQAEVPSAQRVVIGSNTIKNAVLAYYRYQRKFAYVATECWDCDVVASDGARLVDVEVKISWNDYRREFKKPKHTDPDGSRLPMPNRKYFAAPTELARRIAADAETVERGYGVLAISDRGVVSVVKQGKDMHKGKIAGAALQDIVMRLTSELVTMREQVRA